MKMRPISELLRLVAQQAQECLIDERCALQGVLRPLRLKVMVREPPQLVVDDGDQFFESPLITLHPLLEQGCHLNGGVFRHECSFRWLDPQAGSTRRIVNYAAWTADLPLQRSDAAPDFRSRVFFFTNSMPR